MKTVPLKCGTCAFGREPRPDHPARRMNALVCWGTPPAMIQNGTRRVPGLKIGAIQQPDVIEPIWQTENVPVHRERPCCSLWRCNACGAPIRVHPLANPHYCEAITVDSDGAPIVDETQQ